MQFVFQLDYWLNHAQFDTKQANLENFDLESKDNFKRDEAHLSSIKLDL